MKGLEQGWKSGVPVSSEHSKLDPGSLEWKVKLGVGSLVVPCGAESIVVSGALVSTVQVKLSGLASGLPALSIALTEKVWGPSLSEL